MSMVTRFQCLIGTSAQRLAIVPLKGELIYDETMNMMFVGDGVTFGGNPFSGAQTVVMEIFTGDTSISGYDYAIADSPTEIDFTLPNANTYPKPIRVKNAGAGLLNVIPTLGQLIDGLSDLQLVTTNAVVLVPKNGRWFIL